MSFKDLLKEDQKAFFNAEELASIYIVNKKEIVGILEDESSYSKNKNFGNYSEKKKFALSESEWEKIRKPNFGSKVIIDGEAYEVIGFSNNLGVIELKLEANRS